MAEYKGVTHTIVELLSRKKIQAVPRNRNVKRTELDNVGRPDDDRKNSEVPTRQQSIQKQIIDEDKLKKGDRVLHVGGWPGMIAGPQHKWKPPKGTITGTGKHKGELIHSIKVDGKDIENWGHPHDFKKIHEQGVQSVATEPAQTTEPNKGKKVKKLEIQDVGKQKPTQVEINPEVDNTPNIFSSKEEDGKLVEGEWKPPDMKAIKARREAEHIAKFASSLKSFGGFKVTGKLTPEHIKQGAEIRARLNKLKEATNQYNNVSIQYQTRGGTWITARKTSNDPADIMLAMRNVQKVYSQNRVRAVGPRNAILDFQPIDPQNIAVEETKPKEKFVENPKGKIDKQNTGWKSRMAWIKDDKAASDWWKSGHKAYHDAKNKKPLDEGLSAAGVAKSVGSTGVSSGISAALSGIKKAYPKTAGMIDKVQAGYANVSKYMPPGYATFAGQKDVLPAKIVTDYIEKNRAKKEAETQKEGTEDYPNKWWKDYAKNKANRQTKRDVQAKRNKSKPRPDTNNEYAKRDIETGNALRAKGYYKEGTQVSPGIQTIERTLRKIMEARHAGIETDEPKFSQSIQKVAAHAKTYADVEHTYKHADGSKTRVNQELGEKIHRTIHSTPHRHRVDLIQKMHKSASHLKDALKEGKTYKATRRSGEAKALENPVFRKRVVKDKTAYSRKEKHKGKENE